MSGKKIVLVFGVVILAAVIVSVYWFSANEERTSDANVEVLIDSDAAFFEQVARDGYTPPSGQPPPFEPVTVEDETSVVEQTPTIRERLAAIMTQIDDATALTADTVSDCRLLPLGHAPCGGPAFYHVYAVTGSNVSELQQLSTEHQTLARELVEAEEIMGICIVTPEPRIEVNSGTCTAILE